MAVNSYPLSHLCGSVNSLGIWRADLDPGPVATIQRRNSEWGIFCRAQSGRELYPFIKFEGECENAHHHIFEALGWMKSDWKFKGLVHPSVHVREID